MPGVGGLRFDFFNFTDIITYSTMSQKGHKMKVFFNNQYTASKYAFDTTRKSGEIYDSLIRYPIQGVSVADPKEWMTTAEYEIRQVHENDYVDEVIAGTGRATSQGFDWDPNLPKMAIAHSSGLIASIDAILSGDMVAGSLSSGLHHASYSTGTGFCTFNGLAVAAHHAANNGFNNIAIVDFDAHAGGGTYDIIGKKLPDKAFQVDVVVSPFDTYGIRSDDARSTLNIQKGYSSESEYMIAIREALAQVSRNRPDLVIYNAGMDPINAGISRSTLAWREELVAEWQDAIESPLIFALAGGYTWGSVTMDELVNLHRLTIRAFAERSVSSN